MYSHAREDVLYTVNEIFDEITEELERIKRRASDNGYSRKSIVQDIEDLLSKLV